MNVFRIYVCVNLSRIGSETAERISMKILGSREFELKFVYGLFRYL